MKKNIEASIKAKLSCIAKENRISLDETPVIFKEDFVNDHVKVTQWRAFCSRNNIEKKSFAEIIKLIEEFFTHVVDCIVTGKNYNLIWDCQRLKWVDESIIDIK